MSARAKELGLERTIDLESRVTPALASYESNGFALDTGGWREQAHRATEEEVRLKAECDALAPPLPEDARWKEWGWSPSNHRKVGKALELLGAEVEKNPKTGNYKTGEEKLKKIDSPPEAARLGEAILQYRRAAKDASTWGMGWLNLPKKPARGKKFDKSHQFIISDRVYTSFNQVVKTGRMSSEQPNFQNIPPELRRYFIATLGRKLLIADYEQIEFATVAIIAGEERMLEAFRRGEDIHLSNSRKILECDPCREGRPVTDAEVKAFRPKAKTVGFGVIYGMTTYGLARRLSDRFGASTTEEQAQTLIDRLFEGYPTLGEWYQLGVGVSAHDEVLIYPGEDFSEPHFGRSRGHDLLVAPR
jgi:DNA polymerase I